MPRKYMIHTKAVPHRFKAVTESGIIAWEEGCLKCNVCVKKRCVYQVYERRSLDSLQMIDSIDNQCMNCLRCVQGCPKELIHKSVNPEFKEIGDAHWTADIIARLWYQAETGKIPVSGAGYPGPFSGPGFDAMWTDMSEIVRPTRDGIHGREYISTAVDVGRTPDHLTFGESGDLGGDRPSLISIPLPIILRVPSFGAISERTIKGWALGAKRLGTFLALPDHMIHRGLDELISCLIPILNAGPMGLERGDNRIQLVELLWKEDWEKRLKTVRRIHPSALISIRLPLERGVEQRVLSVAKSGISMVHLEGSVNGRAQDDGAQFIRDGIRSVHRALVEGG
ncbi:MAG: hypothetical protein PVG99_12220, partial [Desulfobacteraceae bacterium]